MARVTIEDCLTKVENRFKLVLIAAQRARDIIAGAPKLLQNKNDKEDVTALREISAGLLDIQKLNDAVITRHQRHQKLSADNVNDAAESDMIDTDANYEQESGNKDSIITNMYESESYSDELPEGDIIHDSSMTIVSENDDEDKVD